MKKSTLLAVFTTVLLFFAAAGSGWAQTTIFTESMGTVSSTTTIAAHETANGFDNDDFTMTSGGAANAADIRSTNASSGYTGASGLANVWFTSTSGNYGFAIEGINVSAYTSLSVQFGYRKESATALPTLTLDYWNGSEYVNVPFSFTQAANASVAWYLSPVINLPAAAQINGLRLRWVKSGTVAVRIDDVVLIGTAAGSPAITVTGTFNNFTTTTGTPSASQSVAVSGANLTANIDVSAVAGYEYSTTNAAPWTSTLSLASSFNGNVYVRLTGANAGTFNGTIAFSSTGATTVNKSVSGTVTPPPPANDNCAGAIALTLDATAVTGDVAGATQSIAAISCNLYTGTADDDVWYSFTTTAAGTYTITVIGSTSFDAVVDLRSGACNGTNIDCADATYSGGTETITTTLSEATTYYVRVYSYGSSVPATTTFTIGVATATSPTISVSTFSLSGFTYLQGSGPSTEQTFTVEGVNLTANLTVSPSTNYEVSLTSGSGYSTPISLTPSSGSVATTTIYVRLKAGLTAGNYNSENVAASSTGASTQNVVCSGTVGAPLPTLPLYENFSYTVGQDLTANGWNITGTNASPTIAVTAASISYPGYLSSGIGEEVTMTVSGQDVNKAFAAQTSGTVYASFLVNVSSVATGGDYFFHLGETTIGSTFRGRVFVKRDASNKLAFGIAQSTTPVAYTAFSYDMNTTYLIVLKFDMVSGTGNDVSSIYINPPLNAAIPATGWLANTDASGTDLAGVGSVALRQGGTSAPTLKLDGIRISTNWADIVGAIPAPTISGFNPTSGCSSGGTPVIITGTNFTGATAVTFNGSNAASFTVDNATQITAVTPSGVTTGKIGVTTPGGTVLSAGDFTANSPVTPSVTINASPGTTVANGTSVTFTPTPTNGGSPTYQWYKNSSPVSTAGTYTYVPANNDAVYVVMTSSLGCVTSATANSNTITMTVTVASASTFTGTGNWEDASKWSDGVPGATTNATIDGTATLTDIGECNNCTIGGSGALTVNTGTGLIVNGNLLIASGGSLIASDEDIDITGTTTVERSVSGGQWHFISSPVPSAFSGMFTDNYLQYFTEDNSTYHYIIPTDVSLVVGTGYALWYNATTTAQFTAAAGVGPNTDIVNIGITKAGAGWNLVGNPYPSSLDWDMVTPSNSFLNTAIYIEDAGSWAIYNNGVGVPYSTGADVKYIAPCQGFFVQANAAGTMSLNRSMRTHLQGSFFKKTNEIVNNLVRLEVSGNGYKDEAVVRIKPEATNLFDGDWDAHKFYNETQEAANIYSLGDTQLAINALPEAVPVTVGIHAAVSGTYTIAATEINDLTNVKLEDTKTGTITSLAEKSYTFNWEAGENENRFILRFAAVGTPEPEEATSSIYSYDKTAIIDLPANVSGNVYVYNLAGQPVAVRESVTGQVRIGLSPTGVYVVKVVTEKETLTKKVWIR